MRVRKVMLGMCCMVFFAGGAAAKGVCVKEVKSFDNGTCRAILYTASSQKKDDTTLCLQQHLPGGAHRCIHFCNEGGDHCVVVKSFEIIDDGMLSLVVPFDDDNDYSTSLDVRTLEERCIKKGDDWFVTLPNTVFQKCLTPT